MSDPNGYHEIRTVEVDPRTLEEQSMLLENGWKVVGTFVETGGIVIRFYLVISKWHGKEKS
jgi:hypothetical protein